MTLYIYDAAGNKVAATDSQKAAARADLSAASSADLSAVASTANAASSAAASAQSAASAAQSTATAAGSAAAAAQATAAAAYVKPANGIPHNDLHQGIREQLDLAESALQPGALPAGTTVTAAQVSDASAAGRSVLTAADAAAQRAVLGLGNVNNTSDAGKPISTATQAALDGKMPNTLAGMSAAFTAASAADEAAFQSLVSADLIPGIPSGRIVGRWDPSVSLSGLADGAAVQRLPDISGNGGHLIQSTSSKQPTKRAAPGGKACLLFDGADDSMTCPTFGLVYPLPSGHPQPISVFMAYAGTSSTASFASLISGVQASYSARILTSSDRVVFPYASSSGPGCGADIRDGVWRTVSMSLDTAAVVVCQDGYLASYATTAAAGGDGIANLYIGGLASGNYFNGYIGEIIIISGRMTLQEIDRVNSYLTKKWSAASTPGTAAGVGAFEQTTSPNGQSVRIWTPQVVGDTAVIVCHKHTGNEQYAQPAAEYCLIGSLQSAGYVVGASYMHGDCWGSSSGQSDVVDLWSMLKARHPSLTKLVLLAFSMGGLAAMNIVMANTISELKGVYGIDAVSSLANMHANASYTSSIRTAYGVAADGSDYATKTSGFDPMLASVPVSALTKRYVFVSSSGDTAVNQAANSLSMISRLAGAIEVTSITHSSTHLAPVAMRSQSVVDFVRRCAA